MTSTSSETIHQTAAEQAPGQAESAKVQGRSPGRPRSERAEKAILEATLDLLAEEAGVAGVTIEAVAARAGVGKTTIYRRWPNKEKLIIDAMASMKAPIPETEGRDVRSDLIALARSVHPGGADPRSNCLWNIIGGATKHPELALRYYAEVVEPRREVMRRAFRRGIESGQLDPDLDIEVAITIIVGGMSLQARNYNPDQVPDKDFPERLVDTALNGFAARP